MIPEAQNSKFALLVPPQLKNDGDLAGNIYIDTMGWGYAEFRMATGTIDAALGSVAETIALKLEECDTPDGTYTEVTGGALADAIADTEDDKIFGIDVNLATFPHKRYMRFKAPHAGAGVSGLNACGWCSLSKPEIGPTSAAERGLQEHIIVG